MTLDEHEITQHEGGTWSAEPSIICPHDCGAQFFVVRGQVEWAENLQS
jgi:hypothetical protein